MLYAPGRQSPWSRSFQKTIPMLLMMIVTVMWRSYHQKTACQNLRSSPVPREGAAAKTERFGDRIFFCKFYIQDVPCNLISSVIYLYENTSVDFVVLAVRATGNIYSESAQLKDVLNN